MAATRAAIQNITTLRARRCRRAIPGHSSFLSFAEELDLGYNTYDLQMGTFYA